MTPPAKQSRTGGDNAIYIHSYDSSREELLCAITVLIDALSRREGDEAGVTRVRPSPDPTYIRIQTPDWSRVVKSGAEDDPFVTDAPSLVSQSLTAHTVGAKTVQQPLGDCGTRRTVTYADVSREERQRTVGSHKNIFKAYTTGDRAVTRARIDGKDDAADTVQTDS